MDIASLAIQINTSDVSRAGQELDKLATTGKKAEAAADGVEQAWSDASKAVAGTAAPAKTVSAVLERSAAAFSSNSSAMERAGLSAGQYQQALRMLPMQLTDVATSLASGMPIWMVAIQQGGQVRDAFGGIGNAARAVASEIGPLNLAFGAAAATIGAAFLAFEKGQSEMAAFNEALILTGRSAGVTASQLTDMAREMDAMTGVTQSSASAALAQVAASGQFAGHQLALVGTAAEQMRVATGKAIEETIAEFVKLGDDPVKTLLDLNDKYHFLTSAQLDQIRTLQEQNRHQDAATEAMRLYAGVIAERTPQVLGNLGSLERAWLRIKQMAGEAADAVFDIGRPGSLTEQIAEAEAALTRNRNLSIRSFDDDYAATELEQRLSHLRKQVEQERQASTAATVDTTAERARQQAQEAWERRSLRYASDHKKLEQEIKEIRADGLKAGAAQSEIDKQISAATKQFEERQAKASRPRAFTDDAAARMLQQLREQEASLQAQLAGNDKLTAAQRAQVEWAQQLADLKNKSILTADQKSLLANQGAITAQLAENAALDEQLRKREQLAELERIRISILRGSGQTEAANAAQFELEYAQQRLEYERQGNTEALVRLEALRKIQEINGKASLQPGTVEGVSKAPDSSGASPEVAGPFSDLARFAEEQAKLDEWRAVELQRQTAYLVARTINEEVYAERVRNIHEQHQKELSDLEAARQQVRLEAGEEFFGNMSGAAKAFFGEQSALYRVAFATEKAFAMAKILLNAPSSYSKAFDAVVGIPIVGPALAPAAGAAAIAAQMAQAAALNSVNFAGMFDKGGSIGSGQWGIAGEYGPEIIEGPARVVSRADTARLFAESGSGKQNTAAPNVQIINNGEPVRARTELDGKTLKIILDRVEQDFTNKMVSGDGKYPDAFERSYLVQRRAR